MLQWCVAVVQVSRLTASCFMLFWVGEAQGGGAQEIMILSNLLDKMLDICQTKQFFFLATDCSLAQRIMCLTRTQK